MRVVVTGSDGFIGRRVVPLLRRQGATVLACDVESDILSDDWVASTSADAAVHLAAHKHAPVGETHPAEVADLNIRGTVNVVDVADKVVLASTCKAADPITCYGASKLIAERIVLNANGVVVRLVNVLGSSGSVAELWAELPADAPLPVVTECERMFISPDHAARALVGAIALPSGRYAPAPRRNLTMLELAHELHPARPVCNVPLRVGDRPIERLLNEYERFAPAPDGFTRIVDCWEQLADAAPEATLVGVTGET